MRRSDGTSHGLFKETDGVWQYNGRWVLINFLSIKRRVQGLASLPCH